MASGRADTTAAAQIPIANTIYGDQPVNMNVQLYYNVVRPALGSDWQLRFTFQLLFPK